jgi:hypothetical protein
MKKGRGLLLASTLLLLALAAGCRGEKDKGINRGKDVPLPTDSAAKAPG